MTTETCSWCARVHNPGPENCLSGVLLVCGGRRYGDGARVRAVLDKTAERVEILAIRHGDAFGADRLAGKWAEENGYPVQVYKNPQTRIDAHVEGLGASSVVAVVAFPGGDGTADMVRRARAAGVPVWEVKA
jgi:predicted polyphosphate/ATP-dependent NAD kinase